VSINSEGVHAVQTKAPADFKVVGKSIARADIPGKLTAVSPTCMICACLECCMEA
jgi:hypothetical protein